jgi:hypothetical protein
MALKTFFVHEKSGRQFEIMSGIDEKGEITLKGKFSVFTQEYNKDHFKQIGYTVKQIEVPDEEVEEQDDSEE